MTYRYIQLNLGIIIQLLLLLKSPFKFKPYFQVVNIRLTFYADAH